MANSCIRSLTGLWLQDLFPARSQGPLGFLDQGDPSRLTLLGDTPGVLGFQDHGDPCLPSDASIEKGTQLARDREGRPLANGTPPPQARQYSWCGSFDRQRLAEGFRKFKAAGRFNLKNTVHLVELVGFLEDDDEMSDLRWMAYLLATAYWETSHIEKEKVSTVDKKGHTVEKEQKHWVNMTPVSETGKGQGRRYAKSVKVHPRASGDVEVTEQDGDRFLVGKDGKYKRLTTGGSVGANATAAATTTYTDAPGSELAYFGRGYCQLTWWNNYASAGVILDRGLELLLDPEKALDPAIAYELMARCMRTGQGFANKHKFSDYFGGTSCDYVGARRMVNGTDHATDIAKIATMFEDLLYESRAL